MPVVSSPSKPLTVRRVGDCAAPTPLKQAGQQCVPIIQGQELC